MLQLFDKDFWKFSAGFCLVLIASLYLMNTLADRLESERSVQLAAPLAQEE